MVRGGVENHIGVEGARAVAEALKVNQTVTQVHLGGTCQSGSGEHTCASTDVAILVRSQ